MAVSCVVGDVHLINSVATGFTTSLEPFSIAVWINATWNSATAASFVGMYGPATPTTAVQIGTRNVGTAFAPIYSIACWTWGGGILVSSNTPPSNGVWHHVVYTFDGTNHRLFVDGALVGTSTTAQSAGQFSMVCINGYPTGVANETSTHQVDSYSYYSRTLSVEEISTMYHAHGGSHQIVNGLIAMYEFDELSTGSSATRVVDLSGNGNDLLRSGGGTGQITYSYAGTVASTNLRRVH